MGGIKAVALLVVGAAALVGGAAGVVFADGSCTGIAIPGGIICSGTCPANPGATCDIHVRYDPYWEDTWMWCGCSTLIGEPCCAVIYIRFDDGGEDFDADGVCSDGAGDPNCPDGICTLVQSGAQRRGSCIF